MARLIICRCWLPWAWRWTAQTFSTTHCSLFLQHVFLQQRVTQSFLQKPERTHLIIRKFSKIPFCHKGWYLLLRTRSVLLILRCVSGAYCSLFSGVLQTASFLLFCCDFSSLCRADLCLLIQIQNFPLSQGLVLAKKLGWNSATKFWEECGDKGIDFSEKIWSQFTKQQAMCIGMSFAENWRCRVINNMLTKNDPCLAVTYLRGAISSCRSSLCSLPGSFPSHQRAFLTACCIQKEIIHKL